MGVSASSTAADAWTAASGGRRVVQAGPHRGRGPGLGHEATATAAAARASASRFSQLGQGQRAHVGQARWARGGRGLGAPRPRRGPTAPPRSPGRAGRRPGPRPPPPARASSAGRPKGVRTSRAMSRTVPTTSDTPGGGHRGYSPDALCGWSSSSSWSPRGSPPAPTTPRTPPRRPAPVRRSAPSCGWWSRTHLTIFDPLQPAGPDDTEAATARLADAAPAEVAEEMRLLADTFAEVTAVLDAGGPVRPGGRRADRGPRHRRGRDRRSPGGGERLRARRVRHRPRRHQQPLR